MKKIKKTSLMYWCSTVAFLLIISIIVSATQCGNNEAENDGASDIHHVFSSNLTDVYSDALQTTSDITAFAEKHGLKISDWPQELADLMEKNPETRNFVLNYPLKKDLISDIDLEELKNSSSVPLLMQWDERWGYGEYAGGLMGLTGCGPTCLSMVCIYLLDDAGYTPRYIAEFAEENGYAVSGHGSAWSLISDGGEMLGLDVTELPLDENRIIRNLEAGNPVICVMGPGDFTTTGHFIVMTEYADGKVRVNDPNSFSRSEKLWELSDIKNQIRNLWACRV